MFSKVFGNKSKSTNETKDPAWDLKVKQRKEQNKKALMDSKMVKLDSSIEDAFENKDIGRTRALLTNKKQAEADLKMQDKLVNTYSTGLHVLEKQKAIGAIQDAINATKKVASQANRAPVDLETQMAEMEVFEEKLNEQADWVPHGGTVEHDSYVDEQLAQLAARANAKRQAAAQQAADPSQTTKTVLQ